MWSPNDAKVSIRETFADVFSLAGSQTLVWQVVWQCQKVFGNAKLKLADSY